MSLLNEPYTHPDVEAIAKGPVTKFSKGYYGYEAVTEIPLPGVTMVSSPEGAPTLRISTMKRSSGGLATTASVVAMAADGKGFSFAMFQDFSKTLRVDKVRCTEKNVRLRHGWAMGNGALEALVAEARAFYAAKGAA